MLGRASQERGTGNLALYVLSIDHTQAERLHVALLNQQDLFVLSFVLRFLVSFPSPVVACALLQQPFRRAACPCFKILHLRWVMGVVGGLWRWMLRATVDNACPGSKTKCYGTRTHAAWIIPSHEDYERRPNTIDR